MSLTSNRTQELHGVSEKIACNVSKKYSYNQAQRLLLFFAERIFKVPITSERNAKKSEKQKQSFLEKKDD